MRKLAVVIVLALGFTAFFACGEGAQSHARSSMILRDAENTTCPVTGREITRKRFNTGYRGKRYWFSSYDAVTKFKEDPAHYVANLEAATETSQPRRERRY